MAREKNIPVIPVHSEGFKGTKKDGYKAACDALFSLTGTGDTSGIPEKSINILGEFNLAGEAWIIKDYYKRMGINIVSVMTGDGRIDEIRKSHGAALNVVQCSGSMTNLAVKMEEKYKIPFIRVSYFGLEDMSDALYKVAGFFGDREILEKTKDIIKEEVEKILPKINEHKKKLAGKKAALYVGGAFKAFSLIKALNLLGMEVVIAGSQTGDKDDYEFLRSLLNPGAVIVDDSNPQELSRFALEKNIDLFVGGVKERPMAMKLGIAFCDHNHERKIPLAGFIGMLNFTDEVYRSVMSPVWKFSPTVHKRRKL
jgi:nitrogenase molybdenum-cofactor synthesis protein NifE